MVRGRKRVSIFGHDLGEAPLDLDMTPRLGQKTGPRVTSLPQPDIRSGPVDSFTGVKGLGTKGVLVEQAKARDNAAVQALMDVNPRAAQQLRMGQAKNWIMSGANNMAFKESLAGKRVRGGASADGSDQLRGFRDHVPDENKGKLQMALMGLQQAKGFEDMDDFIRRSQMSKERGEYIDPNTFIRNFRGR